MPVLYEAVRNAIGTRNRRRASAMVSRCTIRGMDSAVRNAYADLVQLLGRVCESIFKLDRNLTSISVP